MNGIRKQWFGVILSIWKCLEDELLKVEFGQFWLRKVTLVPSKSTVADATDLIKALNTCCILVLHNTKNHWPESDVYFSVYAVFWKPSKEKIVKKLHLKCLNAPLLLQ